MNDNFKHSKLCFSIADKFSIYHLSIFQIAVALRSPMNVKILIMNTHSLYTSPDLAFDFDYYVKYELKSGLKNKVGGFRVSNVFWRGTFLTRFFSFILEKGYVDLFDIVIGRDFISVYDVFEVLH
ncbi:MAG: hypothetical protein ABDH21_06520 [bacterium]